MRLHVRVQRSLLGEPFLAHLAFVRSFPSVRSQVHDQVLSNAERLAADLADVRLLPRMYPHVDLQVRFAGHRLPADLASDQVFPSVYPEVHLQRALPIALEVAHGALVLLPFPVGLHVRAKIRGTRVWRFADPADEWLLASVG